VAPIDSGELQAVLAKDLGRRKRQSIPKDRSRTGAEMSVPRTVAEVLADHVTLEVEGIDRMYLNVYVGPLQREGGVAGFFRFHRGHQFASSALMDPISKNFITAMEAFARREGIPIVRFPKGQRKDDVAAQYLKTFTSPAWSASVDQPNEPYSGFLLDHGQTGT
jgi:hypothetical protein